MKCPQYAHPTASSVAVLPPTPVLKIHNISETAIVSFQTAQNLISDSDFINSIYGVILNFCQSFVQELIHWVIQRVIHNIIIYFILHESLSSFFIKSSQFYLFSIFIIL